MSKIFFLVFIFPFNYILSQNSRIIMANYSNNLQDSLNTSVFTLLDTPMIKYKTTVPKNISKYHILELNSQKKQRLYYESLEARNRKDFKLADLLMAELNGDTLGYTNKLVRQNILVLSGLNVEKKRIIIIDKNQNLNFLDDHVYVFKKDSLNDIPLSIQQYNTKTKKIEQHKINFSVVLDKYYYKPVGDTLSYVIGRFKNKIKCYKSSYLEEFNFLIVNNGFVQHAHTNNSKLFITPKSQKSFKLDFDKFHKLKDTLLLYEDYYVFDSILPKENAIALTKLSKSIVPMTGSAVNFNAHKITGIDILSNKYINTSLIKNKFILLDFWGTWCAPCLENTDLLIKLHNTYSSKLEIIGMDFDDSNSLALKYILDKSIPYLNIFEAKNEHVINSYKSLFKVMSYPTFILIDKKGKIIARETGKQGLEIIAKQLEELN